MTGLQLSWQRLGEDMPLLLVGIIAFLIVVIGRFSAPTSLPCDTDRLHPEPKCADRACGTDRIELSRIELDPSLLPPTFVVFDLETTGLSPAQDEIVEIAAIRVGRDAEIEVTFRTLVKPTSRIPGMITQINGISQAMVDSEGIPLARAIRRLSDFIQNLPLVSFNADFDMAFLRNAARRHDLVTSNPASCVLKMARLAWPGRKSYKLSDIAKDAGLSQEGAHQALLDCKLALVVYVAAVSILGTATAAVSECSPERPYVSPRMHAFRQKSHIPDDPVERNLLGIELESDGFIDSAIECYQANVRDGFDGNHPYDRLAVILRRRRDAAGEIAVLTRAIEVFSQLQSSSRSDVAPKLEKFKQRLHRVYGQSKKAS
jgi:DNA polymerase III subunit epsilon